MSSAAAAGQPGSVAYYHNHAWQVLEERVFDDEQELERVCQNVCSPRYIDSLILRDACDPATGAMLLPERLFYLADANYNVAGVVRENPASPGEWHVVERYVYDPYGRVVVLNGDPAGDPDGLAAPEVYPAWSADPDGRSDRANRTLYTGRELDAESGLMYYRARYYDAGLGAFISRDAAKADPNLYRYCRNNPIIYVDPSGLIQEPLTDARREELLTKAWDQLRQLHDSGKITRNEARLRWAITKYALYSPFNFNAGGWRNPEYWTDAVDEDGQYTVRSDRRPDEAIRDAWTTPGYSTGCLKACGTIVLRGVIHLCDILDYDYANNTYRDIRKYRDAFNRLIGTNVPTDLMAEFGKTDTGTFTADDYLPGDRAWMKNPCWFALSNEERKKYPGEEGSNVIAIGGGLFVSYNGNYIYDTEGLQKYICHNFDSVPAGTPLERFKFRERFRPTVPAFIGS